MKKSNVIMCIFAVCILSVISCKKQNLLPSTDAETSKTEFANLREEIETISEDFVIAFNKADSTRLSSYYAKEAKMMLPNEKAVSGREKIKSVFHSWFKVGTPTFTMQTVDVWGNEEMMIAEKSFTFSDEKGTIIDSGKSLEYYIKEEGEWKIFRDCYNSDFPVK
ncbi:MAG: nuclear transport factor 2 family protein [Flavobacterium sp.]|nr:nuclear transport factor 2 family protein [Flavobacterium sp.]